MTRTFAEPSHQALHFIYTRVIVPSPFISAPNYQGDLSNVQPLQSPIIPCKSVHFQILHSLPLNPFSTEQPPAIHLAKSKSAQVTALLATLQ